MNWISTLEPTNSALSHPEVNENNPVNFILVGEKVLFSVLLLGTSYFDIIIDLIESQLSGILPNNRALSPLIENIISTVSDLLESGWTLNWVFELSNPTSSLNISDK